MTNEERYKKALEIIRAMLGPPNSEHTKSCISCEGCLFEWEEALQVAQNVLDGLDANDHWGDPIPFDVWEAKKAKKDVL